MKKILFALCLFGPLGSICYGYEESTRQEVLPQDPQFPEWRGQVDQIDSEMRSKTNQKNLFLAKAARAQDQGDRLQFRPDNLGDARRYWQVAETYREKAKLLDLEVNLLQRKRAQILKENNVLDY